MILRSWRGYASADEPDRYPHHLLEKVRPKLERVPGFLGLYLPQRTQATEIEYCVQTLWESMEAIRTFAGPAPDEAVVEPQAAAMLKRYDRWVVHYEVLSAPPRSR